MRFFAGAATLALMTAMPAMAAEESVQEQVLDCLSQVGTGTDWNVCLGVMFSPCADQEIGSETHLSCLASEREAWQVAKVSAETAVLDALTETGFQDLSGLMLAWPKFVDDKCTAVAEGRADISYDAAQLGCQISEIALMTNEFTACIEGRSVEEYCRLEGQ